MLTILKQPIEPEASEHLEYRSFSLVVIFYQYNPLKTSQHLGEK